MSDDAPKAPPEAPLSDDAHTEGGAPTDRAHEDAGDGSLTGSVPAGLTLEQLREAAESDEATNGATG